MYIVCPPVVVLGVLVVNKLKIKKCVRIADAIESVAHRRLVACICLNEVAAFEVLKNLCQAPAVQLASSQLLSVGA